MSRVRCFVFVVQPSFLHSGDSLPNVFKSEFSDSVILKGARPKETQEPPKLQVMLLGCSLISGIKTKPFNNICDMEKIQIGTVVEAIKEVEKINQATDGVCIMLGTNEARDISDPEGTGGPPCQGYEQSGGANPEKMQECRDHNLPLPPSC